MEISENLIAFTGRDGLQARGRAVRLTPHSVVFEIPGSEVDLRISDILSDFKITADGQTLFEGKATVRGLIHGGSAFTCECALEQASVAGGMLAEGISKGGGAWQARFARFLESWQKQYMIRGEFKAVIADMQCFLEDLRLWMDRVELELQTVPANERPKAEKHILDEITIPTVNAIDTFIERFEGIACQLEGDAEAAHRVYLRRNLHPLLLVSPFAHRTYTKPLGYAGDYEVVSMMLRPAHEGRTLFAKLINIWLIGQAPAAAHRNRVKYLVGKLVDETARVCSSGRRARILNLGCGPADEVRQFYTSESVSDRAELTLLDFNEETIGQLRAKLDAIKAKHRPGAEFRLVKKSVQQVLKDSLRPVQTGRGSYDFVYCAGLFDYLTDEVCKRLMDVFYDMLAPGGLLLATNVSDVMNQERPFRHSMEYILDWHLVYRNGAQFRKLAPSRAAKEDVKVITESIGVNVFIEVRKPH